LEQSPKRWNKQNGGEGQKSPAITQWKLLHKDKRGTKKKDVESQEGRRRKYSSGWAEN